MKKSLFFSALLASLLLAGCGKTDKPSDNTSSNNSSNTSSETEVVKPVLPEITETVDYVEAVAVGNLVGDYDLTGIVGEWNEDPTQSTIYFADKGISANITDLFTNKVADSVVKLESVMTGTEGVERAQTGQGPKTGGIKFHNKNHTAGKDCGLTFKFKDGSSVDQVIFEIALWPKTDTSITEHAIQINNTLINIPAMEAGAPINVLVGLAVDDMTEIKVYGNNGRPVITGVKFYNK